MQSRFSFPQRPEDLDRALMLRGLSFKGSNVARNAVKPLVDICLEDRFAGMSSEDKTRLKKDFKLIVLNLIENGLAGVFTAIGLGRDRYAKGTPYDALHLSYTQVMKSLTALEAHGYVERFNGFNDRQTGIRRFSRFYPTKLLSQKLDLATIAPLITPSSWKTDNESLLRWKDEKGSYAKRVKSFPNDHEDIKRLRKINKFLEQFSWPQKGIVYLQWSADTPIDGGRIYTNFQNMPRSRRKDYLTIDGVKTIELDYSANHPRMAMALLGITLGDDPYSEITVKTGLEREKVKKFFQIALTTESKKSCEAALIDPRKKQSEVVFTKDEFNLVADAVLTTFPQMPLFKGIGVKLQSLEGQIALDVLCSGADAGIAVLPLHDAFVTTPCHQSWLYELMEIHWKNNVHPNINPVIKLK